MFTWPTSLKYPEFTFKYTEAIAEVYLAKKSHPPHNGRTVAPEAILFESPCRAHSETQIAQIIC